MYGFRLFRVSITDAVGKASARPISVKDFENSSGQTIERHLEERIRELAQCGALMGEPKLGRSEARRDVVSLYKRKASTVYPRNVEQIRFETGEFRGTGIYLGKLLYGKIGSHTQLQTEHPEPEDISKGAPSHTYRFAFLVPSSGDNLLLATETKSRTNIAPKLAKWIELQAWSTAQTNPSCKSVGLTIKPVKDYESLVDLIQSANEINVSLTKKEINPDSNRKTSEIQYQQKILGASRKQKVVDKVLSWINRDPSGQGGTSSKSGIVEFSDIVSLDLEREDQISFDEGYVSVRQGKGSPKKISPNNLDDIFTYFLGESPVDDSDWLEEVKNVVRRLETDLKLHFRAL